MRVIFHLCVSLIVATQLTACAVDSYDSSPRGESTTRTAEGYNDEFGNEYGGAETADASPKAPWPDFKNGRFEPTERNSGHPWWAAALLWVPNRILDAVDVFRVDVGVGPAAGAVVRVTEWGQVGYRQMMPASVRVGDFGRQFPGIIERSNEVGVGPAFLQSHDREVCPGEVGVGVDVLIVGGYAGICVDELADFLLGLVFIDIEDDDI